MFTFFASTGPQGVLMMTDINSYLDFVLMLFLAFGLAFEIPVATVLLVLTGLVKVETLANKPGLCPDRDLHHRGDPHAARCHLPMHHGDPDVLSL